mmetsp:Transcript_24578/g.46185  ORF Transcript_24578/g.46185 Transcript_24578/m.46185 type:complete len:201 (+) Transcript_24578:6478-7080(+)
MHFVLAVSLVGLVSELVAEPDPIAAVRAGEVEVHRVGVVHPPRGVASPVLQVLASVRASKGLADDKALAAVAPHETPLHVVLVADMPPVELPALLVVNDGDVVGPHQALDAKDVRDLRSEVLVNFVRLVLEFVAVLGNLTSVALIEREGDLPALRGLVVGPLGVWHHRRVVVYALLDVDLSIARVWHHRSPRSSQKTVGV